MYIAHDSPIMLLQFGGNVIACDSPIMLLQLGANVFCM